MKIFISRNGEQLGSWTEEDIRRYFQTGNLIATDHYWREGMAEWEPLAQFLPPLTPSTPVAAAVPPTVTPTSQVTPSAIAAPAAAPTPAAKSSQSKAADDSPPTSNTALIVPLALAGLLAVMIGPMHQDENASEKLGNIIGTVFVLCLLAFPLSLIFRRSWRLLVRCVIVLGCGGLLLIGKQAKEANDKWVSELKTFSAQESKDERQQIAKDGYVKDPHDQKMDAEFQKLHEMAQSETGTSRKLSEASVDILKDIRSHEEACRASEQPMLDLGLAPSKMTSIDELEKRRTAVQNAQQSVHEFVGYLQGLDTTIHDRLAKEGVSQSAIDGFMKGLHDTGRLQSLQSYWQQEETIAGDLLANLDVLKANWGHWHMADGKVIFEGNDALAAYKASVTKLNSDVAAQKTVQEQLLTPAQ